jgi:hypothetical protein
MGRLAGCLSFIGVAAGVWKKAAGLLWSSFIRPHNTIFVPSSLAVLFVFFTFMTVCATTFRDT